MAEQVKVVSYNCRGFPKMTSKIWSKPTLNMLMQDNSIDIICLQETFLSKQDLGCLNSIYTDFQGVGTSTTDARNKIISGHPPGRVAILYRVKHSKSISPIYFNLDWVVGINISSGNKKHVILYVYMKTTSGGQDALWKLCVICIYLFCFTTIINSGLCFLSDHAVSIY